jgi:hypothetical protein
VSKVGRDGVEEGGGRKEGTVECGKVASKAALLETRKNDEIEFFQVGVGGRMVKLIWNLSATVSQDLTEQIHT